jgi:high-affinity nickel-transport protein
MAAAATAVAGRASAGTITISRPLSSIRVLSNTLPPSQKEAIWLGSLYALGHGMVVIILGVIAILAAEFLPEWVDPIMEKVVGVTLIFLAAYLFYSIYRYYRGGGMFVMRSRWMLIFAGVGNAWHWIRSRIGHHEHVHVEQRNYTSRTAFGIGLIHGIGAETGTQALIIATAVGATSKGVAIAALLFFVVGLLISNTVVTMTSTLGFVSARRRQTIYVMAGVIAAVFSLVLGLVFLTESTGILPALDPYFRWIGGPD